MKNLIKNKKKGSTLLIAIFVGLIIMITSTIVLTNLNNEFVTSNYTEQKASSKYLAEAGINNGLFYYSSRPTTLKNTLTSNSGSLLGSYSVSLTNGSITSTGTTVSGTTTKITITIDSLGNIINRSEQ